MPHGEIDIASEIEDLGPAATHQAPAGETPSERAYRVTERLRGRLKDVIQSYGGTEGYMRWVRGEDED